MENSSRQLLRKRIHYTYTAIAVADNVIIYENEMQDYLEYVRNSSRYKIKSTETILESTKNVKDALEISVRLAK